MIWWLLGLVWLVGFLGFGRLAYVVLDSRFDYPMAEGETNPEAAAFGTLIGVFWPLALTITIVAVPFVTLWRVTIGMPTPRQRRYRAALGAREAEAKTTALARKYDLRLLEDEWGRM